MSETIERIYPEAVNLRSMARWERKQGNAELAGVLEGTADLYERTASDLESARKSLDAHQRAVIEQHDEITKLKSQLEEARARVNELETGFSTGLAEIKIELNDLAMMGAVPMWGSLIGRLDDLAVDVLNGSAK